MKNQNLVNHAIEVENDILNATQYYLEISDELADRFLNQLENAEKTISERPLSFAIKYKNIRTYLLKPFPYHIHFVVEKKEIIILSVAYSKQNDIDFHYRIK